MAKTNFSIPQTRNLKRREFSLQEAGRALAIDYIHLSYQNSKPFLVPSSNDASGDKFLPANEDITPVFPFIPSGSFFSLRIERTKFTYTRVRNQNQQSTSYFPTILIVLKLKRKTGVARSEKRELKNLPK